MPVAVKKAVVMNDDVFKSGNYTTSYIPRYDMMNRTVKYIEEKKANEGSGKKVAAAMAGVQAQISAMNSGQ